MHYNAYKTEPLAKYNRKLVGKLKSLGYRNVRCDFDTLPPLGDFVECPDLPIPVLISCEIKKYGTWVKLRAIFLHTRGVAPSEEFKRAGIEEELIEGFKYCEEHTKLEDLMEIEDAEKTLREEWEQSPPPLPNNG